MQGLLDVLKESREVSKTVRESLVSYYTCMCCLLRRVVEIFAKNMQGAWQTESLVYNQVQKMVLASGRDPTRWIGSKGIPCQYVEGISCLAEGHRLKWRTKSRKRRGH